MDTKKVAAAIIRSAKTILLTRRKLGEKLAGYWEFPGGKIEENETIQQCLEREIQEELTVLVAGRRVELTETMSHYWNFQANFTTVFAVDPETDIQ